jgi:hypothetical protein
MSYFLTTADIRSGRKVVLKGRIVTPIEMAGDQIKIAEDGLWHPHSSLQPLTEDQFHEAMIQEMASLVEGKVISTAKAQGRGFQFVLDDNTRVGLSYASNGRLELSILDPSGQRLM